MAAKKRKINGKVILEESITYRLSVIIADFFLLTVILQSPSEAGIITLIRHTIQTLLFAGHEYIWEQISLGITKRGTITRSRSLLKTIIFRIITISNDLLILLFYAGMPVAVASYITVLITIVNTTIYYFHDRFWGNIRSRQR